MLKYTVHVSVYIALKNIYILHLKISATVTVIVALSTCLLISVFANHVPEISIKHTCPQPVSRHPDLCPLSFLFNNLNNKTG